MNIIRKGQLNTCNIKESMISDMSVTYITFDNLDKTGIVRQAFSTRLGGVSQGEFTSMNLSFARNDNPAAVMENYRRFTAIMDCTPDDVVASHQTHTTNVRKVSSADKGKGVTKEKDYSDIDGLITDESGVLLACFFADCVPLYFVDPVHHAIGLAHSGWRGTVDRMGQVTLNAMSRAFGTRPEDVQAVIGPSICQSCYEVSEEVAVAFSQQFTPDEQLAEEYLGRYQQIITQTDINNCLLQDKGNGKYQLDLWYANYCVMREAGIPEAQIEVTDICTCCNPQFLFSHRASHGRRGNLGAFLMLK